MIKNIKEELNKKIIFEENKMSFPEKNVKETLKNVFVSSSFLDSIFQISDHFFESIFDHLFFPLILHPFSRLVFTDSHFVLSVSPSKDFFSFDDFCKN